MSAATLGVIGLGEIAQIVHLPFLASLHDRFETAAFATSPASCSS